MPASKACPGISSDLVENVAALNPSELKLRAPPPERSCRDCKTNKELLEVMTRAV